jgi:catechol 2,3-dioxygenase-like lactoylglutathione lyase family enzyme
MDLLERVRAFYCDVLGFEVGFRPDFSAGGYWLYCEGVAVLHLIEGAVAADPEAPVFMDHVAFRSDDLGGIRARLESAGVTCRVTEISDIGLRQIFFTDPAGVKIEINAAAERG